MTDLAPFILRAKNQTATANGAPTGAGAAGTWGADVYSFLVVAWFDSAETHIDYSGFPLDTVIPAVWEGVGINANETVTVPFTQVTGAVPDHYTVYVQTAATYDLTAAGTKLGELAASVATGDFADPAPGLGTETFATTYTAITINPVLDLMSGFREIAVSAYNGIAINKSYANSAVLKLLTLQLVGTSATHANYNTLLGWLKYGVRVEAEDTISAPADTTVDPWIQYYYGKLTSSSYLNSTRKNSSTKYELKVLIESETLL